jgi:hypothetical protein
MAYKVVSDYTQGVSSNTNVQVYVRARPPSAALSNLSPKELEEQFGISKRDPKRIEVKKAGGTGDHGGGGDKEHAFSFDRVYWTDTAQEEIFNTVCKGHIEHCLKGYNSCAFAYGQTGSGKTHTMFGDKQGDVRGLVPRTVEYLFAQVPRQAVLLKDVKVRVIGGVVVVFVVDGGGGGGGSAGTDSTAHAHITHPHTPSFPCRTPFPTAPMPPTTDAATPLPHRACLFLGRGVFSGDLLRQDSRPRARLPGPHGRRDWGGGGGGSK